MTRYSFDMTIALSSMLSRGSIPSGSSVSQNEACGTAMVIQRERKCTSSPKILTQDDNIHLLSSFLLAPESQVIKIVNWSGA